MNFQLGDYVYPTGLPRQFPCRVEHVEHLTMPSGSTQILGLLPLAGPWPRGTVLVRLCDAVTPIPGDDPWQASRDAPADAPVLRRGRQP